MGTVRGPPLRVQNGGGVVHIRTEAALAIGTKNLGKFLRKGESRGSVIVLYDCFL